MTDDLVKRLRERATLRYMGDCKCGHCQLVHIDLICEAASRLERMEEALRRLADIAENVAQHENIGIMDNAIEAARSALGETGGGEK